MPAEPAGASIPTLASADSGARLVTTPATRLTRPATALGRGLGTSHGRPPAQGRPADRRPVHAPRLPSTLAARSCSGRTPTGRPLASSPPPSRRARHTAPPDSSGGFGASSRSASRRVVRRSAVLERPDRSGLLQHPCAVGRWLPPARPAGHRSRSCCRFAAASRAPRSWRSTWMPPPSSWRSPRRSSPGTAIGSPPSARSLRPSPSPIRSFTWPRRGPAWSQCSPRAPRSGSAGPICSLRASPSSDSPGSSGCARPPMPCRPPAAR